MKPLTRDEFREQTFERDNHKCVIRVVDSFKYGEFQKCTGKYVRENHIRNENHWSPNKFYEVNKLIDSTRDKL